MTIGIGLVGYGYWGPNLFRNFRNNADCRVIGIADKKVETREHIAAAFSDILAFEDVEMLIALPGVDAVVVATPVASHYDIARRALDAGKHVLLEKPMCATSDEASDLIERAKRKSLVLMVDHTFLFTGAVQMIKELVARSALGQVCYFDSLRVNLGLFQPDVNCLWDLAPHDLSIINYLIDDELIDVEASGYCHVNQVAPDMVYLTLHFRKNCIAHLNLSWMSPVKIRRFTIGGTEKMLVWDDLDEDQKIKIYSSGIHFQPEEQRSMIIPQYRIGDIHSPRLRKTEALNGVAEHFADVIQGKVPSIMAGNEGLKIVRTLELAQARLDNNLERVRSQRDKPL
ncbi:Gfo/Idh/MocA family oxidoreductase [Bradyrhizobium sp. 62]|uniref:Gfo/Idh/MocA family protein n=1 Tax=Bradyrhizobium sp. 62 TaxID=1043588 RepID=UPI001FFB0881|nr:Gfo/Idh/MocA family oxidoreductase [Bradyrhizobium sp. 62]MCK1364129.1 Gfo/Idh/MocA family oxidoreductase [Bradyrhizobium sp. 62]